jgi:Zn-dependent protease
MGSTTAFRVARIRGIPIRIHFTFLLVLPFLAYSFGNGFVEAARLAGIPPERIVGSRWLWGLGVALALFASVLVHELAHSLYALRRGGKVRSITLLMIGGVSELAAPPRHEAAMALAGPATSLLLGGALVGLSRVTSGADLPSVSFALFYVGQLNVLLCAFNLLPAFPMDGGRILRGALARKIGPVRATRVAVRVGRVFAVLFAVLGVVSVNILLLFIAVVVFVGAEAELRQVRVRTALGDLRVRDFMSPLEAGVAAEETLLGIGHRMIRERRTAYPVTSDGRVIGLITATGVNRVPPEARGRTLAREAAHPARVVEAGERLADVLHLLGEAVPEIAVVEAGRLVGTLSQLDLTRGLDLRELQARARAADRPGDTFSAESLRRGP